MENNVENQNKCLICLVKPFTSCKYCPKSWCASCNEIRNLDVQYDYDHTSIPCSDRAGARKTDGHWTGNWQNLNG